MSYPVEWEELMEKEAKSRWMREAEKEHPGLKAEHQRGYKYKEDARYEAKRKMRNEVSQATNGTRNEGHSAGAWRSSERMEKHRQALDSQLNDRRYSKHVNAQRKKEYNEGVRKLDAERIKENFSRSGLMTADMKHAKKFKGKSGGGRDENSPFARLQKKETTIKSQQALSEASRNPAKKIKPGLADAVVRKNVTDSVGRKLMNAGKHIIH